MKVGHRFSKCVCINYDLYSYEQTGKHGKLFDVIIPHDSSVPPQFKINSRPSEKTKDHEDIIRHFALESSAIPKRICAECHRELSEDEHNYGTNEDAGNIQVCLQCYNDTQQFIHNFNTDPANCELNVGKIIDHFSK